MLTATTDSSAIPRGADMARPSFTERFRRAPAPHGRTPVPPALRPGCYDRRHLARFPVWLSIASWQSQATTASRSHTGANHPPANLPAAAPKSVFSCPTTCMFWA